MENSLITRPQPGDFYEIPPGYYNRVHILRRLSSDAVQTPLMVLSGGGMVLVISVSESFFVRKLVISVSESFFVRKAKVGHNFAGYADCIYGGCLVRIDSIIFYHWAKR